MTIQTNISFGPNRMVTRDYPLPQPPQPKPTPDEVNDLLAWAANRLTKLEASKRLWRYVAGVLAVVSGIQAVALMIAIAGGN